MDVNAGEGAFSREDGVIPYIALIVRSLRPEQYYKNLLVFTGLIFSLRALEVGLWWSAFAAFGIFCLLSGSMYAINDVFDAKGDRNHPVKKLKPIASGRLGLPGVAAITTVLIGIALALSYLVTPGLLVVSVVFVLLNFAYDLVLRAVPVVDALAISAILALRVIAGSIAVGVPVPAWITLCIFMLALLLVFGKRRSQRVLLGENARDFKRAFGLYDIPRLDLLINALSAALLTAYGLYVYYSGSIYIVLTVPLVLYGLWRYLYLVRSRHICEVSDMLLADGRFVACIVAWVCLNTIALYS